MAIALCLAGIGCAAAWPWLRSHPTPGMGYLGKPSAFWIRLLDPTRQEGGLYSRDFVVDTNAPDGHWHMRWETDTNALPVFVEALRVRGTRLDRLYLTFWEGLPLSVRNWIPGPVNAEQVRAQAVRGIEAMGETFASPAIPALIDVVETDESALVRSFAVSCLETLSRHRLDRDVMDAWVAAAHDPDPTVRRPAIALLRQRCPGVAADAGID